MQEQGKIISCVQLVVVSKQDNSLKQSEFVVKLQGQCREKTTFTGGIFRGHKNGNGNRNNNAEKNIKMF